MPASEKKLASPATTKKEGRCLSRSKKAAKTKKGHICGVLKNERNPSKVRGNGTPRRVGHAPAVEKSEALIDGPLLGISDKLSELALLDDKDRALEKVRALLTVMRRAEVELEEELTRELDRTAISPMRRGGRNGTSPLHSSKSSTPTKSPAKAASSLSTSFSPAKQKHGDTRDGKKLVVPPLPIMANVMGGEGEGEVSSTQSLGGEGEEPELAGFYHPPTKVNLDRVEAAMEEVLTPARDTPREKRTPTRPISPVSFVDMRRHASPYRGCTVCHPHHPEDGTLEENNLSPIVPLAVNAHAHAHPLAPAAASHRQSSPTRPHSAASPLTVMDPANSPAKDSKQRAARPASSQVNSRARNTNAERQLKEKEKEKEKAKDQEGAQGTFAKGSPGVSLQETLVSDYLNQLHESPPADRNLSVSPSFVDMEEGTTTHAEWLSSPSSQQRIPRKSSGSLQPLHSVQSHLESELWRQNHSASANGSIHVSHDSASPGALMAHSAVPASPRVVVLSQGDVVPRVWSPEDGKSISPDIAAVTPRVLTRAPTTVVCREGTPPQDDEEEEGKAESAPALALASETIADPTSESEPAVEAVVSATPEPEAASESAVDLAPVPEPVTESVDVAEPENATEAEALAVAQAEPVVESVDSKSNGDLVVGVASAEKEEPDTTEEREESVVQRREVEISPAKDEMEEVGDLSVSPVADLQTVVANASVDAEESVFLVSRENSEEPAT
jgi:hypothetical protein